MIATKHRNGKKNRHAKKTNMSGIRKAAVTQTSNGNR